MWQDFAMVWMEKRASRTACHSYCLPPPAYTIGPKCNVIGPKCKEIDFFVILYGPPSKRHQAPRMMEIQSPPKSELQSQSCVHNSPTSSQVHTRVNHFRVELLIPCRPSSSFIPFSCGPPVAQQLDNWPNLCTKATEERHRMPNCSSIWAQSRLHPTVDGGRSKPL